MVVSIRCIAENCISFPFWTAMMLVWKCVKTRLCSIGAWSRHLRLLFLILKVVESWLCRVEAWFCGTLWIIVFTWAHLADIIHLVLAVAVVEYSSTATIIRRLFKRHCRVECLVFDVRCTAHSLTRPCVGGLVHLFASYDDTLGGLGLELWNGAVTLNIWLKNRVRLHLLQLFMLVKGLLECGTLLHDLFVFDRDHSVVHVGGHLWIFLLLLVVKARFCCSKWILLISLADLKAKCAYFILH